MDSMYAKETENGQEQGAMGHQSSGSRCAVGVVRVGGSAHVLGAWPGLAS